MKLGLYLHIPFCRQKCLYCDFPSYAGQTELYQRYTAALCREIRGQGGLLPAEAEVDSIYIGGGTPTLLETALLENILKELKEHWPVSETAEISMEANPGTADEEKLQRLRWAGINRLSFGVQTFNDRLLQGIGRIHTAAEARQAVHMAQRCGYNNINVDLMYGLPGQTAAEAEDSIRQAAALGVSHISAYGLKVEEGTPFARMEAQGCLELPDEAEEDAMYEMMARLLPDLGFARYEISNFAQPGAQCRHNLKYWHYESYLGLGAAAHSFWRGQRTANTADAAVYIEAIEQGKSPAVPAEPLTRGDSMAEYVFLALRTINGLDVSAFNQYFAANFYKIYGETVSQLEGQHLLHRAGEQLALTERGMKYGNVVFGAFLPEKR